MPSRRNRVCLALLALAAVAAAAAAALLAALAAEGRPHTMDGSATSGAHEAGDTAVQDGRLDGAARSSGGGTVKPEWWGDGKSGGKPKHCRLPIRGAKPAFRTAIDLS